MDSLRVLLYGESGTGKTSCWASFPSPILALICSGGKKPGELRSINTPENRKRITAKTVNTSADFRREMESAGDYATVVLDHASGFADMILSEIIGKPVPEQKSWGLASQQDYGQLGLIAKQYFRDLLNLPGNVILIAQQRTFGGKDDGGDPDLIKPTVGAALTPSLTGWLNPAVDFVLQTYKRPKYKEKTVKISGVESVQRVRVAGVEYCIRTEAHETFQTKFRMPKGRELPECIVLGTEDSAYDEIMKLINGEG